MAKIKIIKTIAVISTQENGNLYILFQARIVGQVILLGDYLFKNMINTWSAMLHIWLMEATVSKTSSLSTRRTITSSISRSSFQQIWLKGLRLIKLIYALFKIRLSLTSMAFINARDERQKGHFNTIRVT